MSRPRGLLQVATRRMGSSIKAGGEGSVVKTDARAVQAEAAWSPWRPLAACWTGSFIPATAGLYRLRRVGYAGLDYLGQTGAGAMNLRRRLAMLRGALADEMPYRDPHTAAPGLWALRHAGAQAFEASVLPVEGDGAVRKGLEALALALWRQATGHSPTLNFGRMPPGYRMSSGNNARLARAGRRFRGGPAASAEESHEAGMAPVGPLDADVLGAMWCGHRWSAWAPLDEAPAAVPAGATGLYRLRGQDGHALVYVGQGRVRARLGAHAMAARAGTDAQARAYRAASPLEVSWVLDARWRPHQLLELETDLIGAHVLGTGLAPRAQFLGGRQQG